MAFWDLVGIENAKSYVMMLSSNVGIPFSYVIPIIICLPLLLLLIQNDVIRAWPSCMFDIDVSINMRYLTKT